MERPQLGMKSFEIPKRLVYEAWMKVQANNGAPGVDAVSIEGFADNERANLYKLWNRMSSGSYFPGPVRAVEIPKDHGAGVRVLGVPNAADRIAQTAAAMLLEEKLEPIFHRDSYGYRPGRSAHDALAVTRKRCWEKDWVLDLDVRTFFDSVPHDLLLRAVAHHTDERWVLLYIERWLTAPMQMPDGTLVAREKGTPQGSPISPLLANLFMHYAFDRWMDREYPGSPFERYADDVVIHCDTEAKALHLWAKLAERLGSVGLELHPDKTKVVYCKDAHRRGDYEHTSFDFLGYTFRARLAKGKWGSFVNFSPAMSAKAKKAKGKQIRDWHLNQWHGPVWSRPGHQRPGPRLDQLLRGLLSLRVVFHRTAHRPAFGPMGHAEIQTITRETSTGMGLVGCCQAASSPALRSLASPPRHAQPTCKSRMS
jgi:RNA-directed DNA polymerase